MKRTSALDEGDEKLKYVCLMWSTTGKENRSAVVGKAVNNRMGLNVGEWFVVEPFSEILHIGPIVLGNYGIPELIKHFPWLYHIFYINGFCRDNLLNLGSTQSKKKKNAISVVNK